MGDRGNIVVQDRDGKIYLYTHWYRYDLANRLRKALSRARDRWNDTPYLTRVIFDDMVDGDRGLTGFGISPVLTDGDETFIVDTENQTVNGKPFSEWVKVENG